MIFAVLMIAPATAGVALMVKELLKAPVAYQDEQGFHVQTQLSGSHRTAQAHARMKKARRHAAKHVEMGAFNPAAAH